MKYYVGIDLGTTNSSISYFDGEKVTVQKSPENTDVTPSVILYDRRGNKFVGNRAYQAIRDGTEVARLFKRFMGTSTPIQIESVDLTKTPEECSAELLMALFGYLPEEIRNDDETGTVITVPAAFNQMQKDSTMQAAQMANLGKVALMQEPVAAVMSVMKNQNTDGVFVIYDLGGGTFDVAIAESIGGRVNLLEQGGIQMCGGRDWDRKLIDNVVKSWLLENFNLPNDLTINPDYKKLMNYGAQWAAEQAKVALSSNDESVVTLSESEINLKDLDDQDIFLHVPLTRKKLDELIEELISETINSVREVFSRSGLTANSIEKLVFVGGPTCYKPLRDKISNELGIPTSSDVNPMTAVSEGASLYAESIDWSSANRSRKSKRGELKSDGKINLTFKFNSRTPDNKANLVVISEEELPKGTEFQVDSIDSGWTSGKILLSSENEIDIPLSRSGENKFKVSIFDEHGAPVKNKNEEIVITKTAATIEAIPASSSIGIEILDRKEGQSTREIIVAAGDQLPKKGKCTFKATATILAGSHDSINMNLWEGEIEFPVRDNRSIGTFKIRGTDLIEGVISAGDTIECEYEVLDSGNIVLNASIPTTGDIFEKNLYSPNIGKISYEKDEIYRVLNEASNLNQRLSELNNYVVSPKIQVIQQNLDFISKIDIEQFVPDELQEADEKILKCKKLLAEVRKEHLKDFRQMDLEYYLDLILVAKKDASPSEITSFDNLARTANREIERNLNDSKFENVIDEIGRKAFGILWRQNWFVIEQFKSITNSPPKFVDQAIYEDLVSKGNIFLQSGEIDELRKVIFSIYDLQGGFNFETEVKDIVNIVRG